jgi:hypothetical protein
LTDRGQENSVCLFHFHSSPVPSPLLPLHPIRHMPVTSCSVKVDEGGGKAAAMIRSIVATERHPLRLPDLASGAREGPPSFVRAYKFFSCFRQRTLRVTLFFNCINNILSLFAAERGRSRPLLTTTRGQGRPAGPAGEVLRAASRQLGGARAERLPVISSSESAPLELPIRHQSPTSDALETVPRTDSNGLPMSQSDLLPPPPIDPREPSARPLPTELDMLLLQADEAPDEHLIRRRHSRQKLAFWSYCFAAECFASAGMVGRSPHVSSRRPGQQTV